MNYAASQDWITQCDSQPSMNYAARQPAKPLYDSQPSRNLPAGQAAFWQPTKPQYDSHAVYSQARRSLSQPLPRQGPVDWLVGLYHNIKLAVDDR